MKNGEFQEFTTIDMARERDMERNCPEAKNVLLSDKNIEFSQPPAITQNVHRNRVKNTLLISCGKKVQRKLCQLFDTTRAI